jgi:hypothetical protein
MLAMELAAITGIEGRMQNERHSYHWTFAFQLLSDSITSYLQVTMAKIDELGLTIGFRRTVQSL